MTLQEYRRKYGQDMKNRLESCRKAALTLHSTVPENADFAMKGLLVLPSTNGERYFVGNPPRWYEVLAGDLEYICSLNRMEHWKSLLWAYVLSGQEQYAQKIISELDDWISQCPAPVSIGEIVSLEDYPVDEATPWRTLEVGIRMMDSWHVIMDFLPLCESFTPELFERVVECIRVHAHILHTVCPQRWPEADHNHYLHEMLGLLNAAGMVSWLPESNGWLEFAVHELGRCAENMFSDDGGQIEGCPHYHDLSLGYLCTAKQMGQRYGVLMPDIINRRIEGAVNYMLHSLRANGQVVPWGDSDAILQTAFRAAALYSGISKDFTPLDTIYTLVGEDSFKAQLSEVIWEAAHLAEYIPAGKNPDKNIFLDKTLNQAMLRTGWGKNETSIFFSSSCLKHNSHTHIDPLSFDFTALGTPVLVDPGRYSYLEGANRRKFKSAAFHNCLIINGRDPYEYRSSWRFGPMGQGKITNAGGENNLLWACGWHDCYKPVVHHRSLLLLGKSVLLVLDSLENYNQEPVSLFFHLNTTDVHMAKGHALANVEKISASVAWEADFTAELHEGVVSPAIDISYPSTRLSLNPSNGKSCFLTVFAIGEHNLNASQIDYAMADPHISSVRSWRQDGEIRFEFILKNTLYQGCRDDKGKVFVQACQSS